MALHLTYAHKEPNKTHNIQLHCISCQPQRHQVLVGNRYAMKLKRLGGRSLTDLDFVRSESLLYMTRVTACAMSRQWPLELLSWRRQQAQMQQIYATAMRLTQKLIAVAHVMQR